jgi:hypothetical protein
MLGYLKRHHIGLLALFIALGGTSYAATKLPRNSVGGPQIRNGAVSEAKLAKAVRTKLGKAGKAGPAGPAGSKGDTGAAGPKGADGSPGPQGVQGIQGLEGIQGPQGDPGPTSAGFGGVNATVLPTFTTALSVGTASVTLNQTSKVLVFGSGTFSVQCGASTCTRTIGLTLDGAPVRGGAVTLQGSVATTTTQTLVATAIASDVPAGTHTVGLAEKLSGTVATTANGGDVREVGIALGG